MRLRMCRFSTGTRRVCPRILFVLAGASPSGPVRAQEPTTLEQVEVVATTPSAFRTYRDETTVFDSTGWALEDLVVAELVGQHAVRLGVGLEVDLQPAAHDPYDPYAALRGVSGRTPTRTGD